MVVGIPGANGKARQAHHTRPFLYRTCMAPGTCCVPEIVPRRTCTHLHPTPPHCTAPPSAFRYSTPKGEVLDVMYRNIKHALFQPAENEMITVLHCHLHHPIMVGNKKTKDVQFYTEVGVWGGALGGGRLQAPGESRGPLAA